MTKSHSNGDDRQVSLTLVAGGMCRISYGKTRGRFVVVDYEIVKPYILGQRDRAELIKLYNLGDVT